MSNLPLTAPDLVCTLDLDPFGSETTSDFQNLQQDILHVILENPGSNPDDPDRGIGILQYLSGTENAFKGLPGKIDTELTKDSRISKSATTIIKQADGTYVIAIEIQVNGEIIPLQYGVSAAGVTQL